LPPASIARLNRASQSSTNSHRLAGEPPLDGAFAAHHGVVKHDGRAGDADLGVHDLAVGTGVDGDHLGTQRRLVPIDGLRRLVQREHGGDRGEPFGN
jgi:hypothetical protein